MSNNNNEQVKAYLQFMYNRNNEYKCEDCPENVGFDSWQAKLPCGQQNCWVTCHCKDN